MRWISTSENPVEFLPVKKRKKHRVKKIRARRSTALLLIREHDNDSRERIVFSPSNLIARVDAVSRRAIRARQLLFLFLETSITQKGGKI